LQERLAPLQEAIDASLKRLTSDDEIAPPGIREAVQYAVLGNGKRLRPILVLASGRAVGGDEADLLPAASALEMIHAFSLIHDDLPALDDDHLRRGRPTLHVEYGEAVAILAGDALLNLAFQTLSRYPEGDSFATRKIAAIRTVGEAVGLSGMIGGQAMDLEFERKQATGDDIRTIHRLKTGALITAACLAGGILGGASPEDLEHLERYGRALGLAFQITDDILDVEGTAEEIGKSPGKDQRAGKATFPSIWGLERSRQLTSESAAEAAAAVEGLGDRADILLGIAGSIVNRRK
jgi:geranylgeranyl diphosphate synthase type II